MISAPDFLICNTAGVKSWELLVYPWIKTGSIPWALSASTNAFLPPLPKVSVECMIAHFRFFSSLTPYSAITFDEYRSFGRTRKIHGLLALVRLGSLPPINAGTFDFAMVGEAAS